MNKILLVLFALFFAGCTGLPTDGAQMGDEVTARWVAYDLESGQAVASSQAARFVIGTCASGMGAEVERALIGSEVGETLDIVSKDDPSREYRDRVSVEHTIGPNDKFIDFSRAQFEGQLGPAAVGMEFDLSIYVGRVEVVTNETVTYSVNFEEGQRDPLPFLGSEIETRSFGDDQFVQILVPIPGSTFTITRSQDGSTPLGLPTGVYKSVSADDTMIHFLRNPGSRAEVMEIDLRFEVEVTAVTPGTELAGNEGLRRSPAVLCDPTGVTWTPVQRTLYADLNQPADSHDDHDDGHADDGHTH